MYESETSKALSPDQITTLYAPGTVVRVSQQTARTIAADVITVTGKVLRQERQPSGSWFARNKRNKVWLDRLVIEKADGEISILNLDEYTHIEVISGPAGVKADSPMVEPAGDMSASTT